MLGYLRSIYSVVGVDGLVRQRTHDGMVDTGSVGEQNGCESLGLGDLLLERLLQHFHALGGVFIEALVLPIVVLV